LIGPATEGWLIAAAAAATNRLRRKDAEAVALAKIHGDETVDDALRAATDAGRLGTATWRRLCATATAPG
jgi:hypothetical protein